MSIKHYLHPRVYPYTRRDNKPFTFERKKKPMSLATIKIVAEDKVHTQSDVIAMIHCLIGCILTGNATEKEIATVSKLAKKYNCFGIFAEEIKNCSKMIMEGNS